ncbi:MAG: uroporphyrinogen decarboxylase family protein [Spirochaetaceae bacterium]|jgi:uroporphyrinogen-III decarboxylase|nr:uroporphyrinogen decarboxylase family protein [Spirochaetaceae bacterium]
MTSRERIIAAINHRQPDQVPLDLGGCGQTGINASTLYALRRAYGLKEHPITVCEPMQLLGEVEKDLLTLIGADVVPLWNRSNMFGLSGPKEKPWRLGDGTPVLMNTDFEYDVTDSGYTMVYPCGNRQAPHALQMPPGGTFFDNIYRAPPVDEDDLRPLEDYRENYTVKTEEDCLHWERESKRLYEETDYAIVGVLGGMGLGDVAEIPGPWIARPRGIRDIPGWLMAHITYPDYIRTIFEFQTETALKNLELYRQAVGDRIQVIWLSGTDFGTQCGLMQSREIFLSLYKPCYEKVNRWVHANTPWKTFYHSCGAVEPLIADFIDMGVDILNPVQCSAAGMDSRRLKQRYGDKIVFWGGGVDTQKTLPRGSPEDVRKEVRKRLEVFSPGGGFVFAAIHNVLAKVPPENIVAMFDVLREFRGR